MTNRNHHHHHIQIQKEGTHKIQDETRRNSHCIAFTYHVSRGELILVVNERSLKGRGEAEAGRGKGKKRLGVQGFNATCVSPVSLDSWSGKGQGGGAAKLVGLFQRMDL